MGTELEKYRNVMTFPILPNNLPDDLGKVFSFLSFVDAGEYIRSKIVLRSYYASFAHFKEFI